MQGLQLTLVLAAGLLTGCVTGTRTVDLGIDDYTNEVTASGGVYIAAIEDQRAFEDRPPKPSTPSVDGDLEAKSKEEPSTYVGRQRNGYGAAMGDVALPEGKTVQQVVRELLTEGLESRGYNVVDDPSAANQVSVDIQKFWGWFSPGMFSVSFEADLQCQIELNQGDQKTDFDIVGYGLNKGQVASNENCKNCLSASVSELS